MFCNLKFKSDKDSSREVFETISSELLDLRKSVGSAVNDCQSTIDDLNQDSGGFLSDHIWYPDNPARKQKAITLFRELKEKYETSEKLIDKNIINIKDLEDIYITTKSWDSYLTKLTPITETSLVLNNTDSNTFNFKFINSIIAINAGAAWKLLNWAKGTKGSFGGSAVVVSLALGFITSIFSGASRKKNFEEMITKATEAIEHVDNLNNELISMDRDARDKFYEISTVLEEGSFVKKGTFTKLFDDKLEITMDNADREEFFAALYNATEEMKIWSNGYSGMLISIKRRKLEVLAAADMAAGDLVYEFLAKELGYDTVLNITDEDEKKYEKEIIYYTANVTKLFVLTYQINIIKNDDDINKEFDEDKKLFLIKEKINEITKLLILSDEEKNYMLIRALLLNNFNPHEIIEIVDLPKAKVEEKIESIQNFDEQVNKSYFEAA